ncbi:hypothetical protein BDF21DRAFT_390546 [Thamnidium elegans]|uniref:Myb-like domain-containing protein n=1 Tax=Thamnidium elegans TaxID=101142 RepID=A0A8H7SSR1_9FUNG|nr:hypothetical protein INT48_008427 [Thamnidium elegans]KAI8058778.1 hypothetical protein BDF21DRAFT_390546 [Thamnidium elegans]
MNVSELLNPLNSSTTSQRSRCISTPIIPLHNSNRYYQQQIEDDNNTMIGKPRSRFSEYEDNIIRNGVAQRLTWGQISDLLPHRKRATCFNRYRTLQGIRKSRKQSSSETTSPLMTCSLSTTSTTSSLSPLSPVTSCFGGPTTPPPSLSLPPLVTSWSSADIIYPINKHQDNGSSDSSFPSEDDEQFHNKRSHRVALPAIRHYQQPYYNL